MAYNFSGCAAILPGLLASTSGYRHLFAPYGADNVTHTGSRAMLLVSTAAQSNSRGTLQLWQRHVRYREATLPATVLGARVEQSMLTDWRRYWSKAHALVATLSSSLWMAWEVGTSLCCMSREQGQADSDAEDPARAHVNLCPLMAGGGALCKTFGGSRRRRGVGAERWAHHAQCLQVGGTRPQSVGQDALCS